MRFGCDHHSRFAQHAPCFRTPGVAEPSHWQASKAVLAADIHGTRIISTGKTHLFCIEAHSNPFTLRRNQMPCAKFFGLHVGMFLQTEIVENGAP